MDIQKFLDVAEPVTALTDFLFALLAWWCAWNLRQSGFRIEQSRRLWACGLGTQGAAALLGGIYHGFVAHFDPQIGSFLWHLTLILMGTASTLMVAGLGIAALSTRTARLLIVCLGIKLLCYIAWVWQRQDFFPALCDQAVGLFLLAGLAILGRHRLRSAILPIALGLCAIVVGGLIQNFRLGISQHFNHNDIYHLFGGLGLWCFYRAGPKLYDS